MSNLNNRQVEFVKLLLKENEYKPIKYFSTFLKTSCKTLQKDLRVIEKYLNKFNIVLARKRGTGIMIVNAKDAKCLLYNNIKWQEKECKKVSVNERRIEIARNMLINSGTATSIQKLSDMYYVSKTSISADLSCIEKWVSNFNLIMERSVEGTRIRGNEVDIRKMLNFLLAKYPKRDYKNEGLYDIAARIDPDTLSALSESFGKDKVSYINQYLVELEKKYDCRLNDTYYINLLTHILISLTRALSGKQIKEKIVEENYNYLKSERAYEEAVNMINRINEDFNVKLDESEVYYLYQYFVSFGLVKNTTQNADEVLDKLNFKAKVFTEKVTNCIEKIIHIDISNDEIIMKSLLLHVRPMLNRLNYDIKVSNPLMEDIKKEYPELLSICEIAVLMISHELKQKEIPIDEIGYLTLYYQTALERLPVKKRVYVVCQSGLGTSQLLTTRIKKVFPQLEVAGVLSVSMLKKRNLDDVDFIISTVPIDIKEKPYILVSAFLNDQDIKNISKILTDKHLGTNNIETGTFYINKFIIEENIFFNEQDAVIIKDLNKKYEINISFRSIVLSDSVSVYIGFCNQGSILALNINNNISTDVKVEFYIAMEDMNVMTNILSEIYHLRTSKEFAAYLRKYRNPKKIMDYFKMYAGKMEFSEDDFRKVIKKENTKLNMDATTKEEALLELVTLLDNSGALLDKDAFLNDVYYREKLGPSGIGNKIAIPHGKSKFVNETTAAIGKTKVPIKWESLDNEPVQFIVLFAVADNDKGSINSLLLSQVAIKLGQDKACKSLLYTNNTEEIYRIFAEN
ncbi:MAG TPA: transcriptional regulator ManR [Clostridiaceae bacterium]|nr:transcriptional regulator ManR [Clostridiaceae bacterium]